MLSIAKLKQTLRGPLGRYILVGGSVYVLELLVIVIAQRQGASQIIAVGLSFWVGLVVSFILQKIFTFNDKRTHHRVLLPQILAVGALILFNFGFTVGMVKLTESMIPVALTRTIAIGCTTLWNFYLYKTRIFKTPIVD